MDHHHMLSHNGAISILLIIGSSTELALFHAGCRPSHHVGLLQRLYLTLKSEWLVQLLHLTSSCQKGTPSTHIWPHFVRKAQHSHLTMCKHIVPKWIITYIWPHLIRKDLHLHLNSSCQKGFAITSDLILLERLCTYIQPCSKTSHQKGS